MTMSTFSELSLPPSELNALAPLRVPGLAKAILENKDNPAEIERLGQELMELSRHLIELLITESEKLPELETV